MPWYIVESHPRKLSDIIWGLQSRKPEKVDVLRKYISASIWPLCGNGIEIVVVHSMRLTKSKTFVLPLLYDRGPWIRVPSGLPTFKCCTDTYAKRGHFPFLNAFHRHVFVLLNYPTKKQLRYSFSVAFLLPLLGQFAIHNEKFMCSILKPVYRSWVSPSSSIRF